MAKCVCPAAKIHVCIFYGPLPGCPFCGFLFQGPLPMLAKRTTNEYERNFPYLIDLVVTKYFDLHSFSAFTPTLQNSANQVCRQRKLPNNNAKYISVFHETTIKKYSLLTDSSEVHTSPSLTSQIAAFVI